MKWLSQCGKPLHPLGKPVFGPVPPPAHQHPSTTTRVASARLSQHDPAVRRRHLWPTPVAPPVQGRGRRRHRHVRDAADAARTAYDGTTSLGRTSVGPGAARPTPGGWAAASRRAPVASSFWPPRCTRDLRTAARGPRPRRAPRARPTARRCPTGGPARARVGRAARRDSPASRHHGLGLPEPSTATPSPLPSRLIHVLPHPVEALQSTPQA